MTIKALKDFKQYRFFCDISKERVLNGIAETNIFDEWGSAYISLGENIGVEYNICIDNTTNDNINCSAIYKLIYDEKDDCMEVDTSKFIPYVIDFNNSEWKIELENAMCKALIKFFDL